MKTVTLKDVSNMAMVSGNENHITKIIHEGMVKEWCGIGWIEEGEPSQEDWENIPFVEGHSEKPLERWILDALEEYRVWHKQALPSSNKYQPRVFVDLENGKTIARRPFKNRDHWSVRCVGVGRLVNPRRNEFGNIVFSLDYS